MPCSARPPPPRSPRHRLRISPREARTANHRWQLRLLGGLSVVHDDQLICELSPSKPAALLACLATHMGQRRPREALMELLWPEVDPEKGRLRLRVALGTMRKWLSGGGANPDGLLQVDRSGLQIPASAVVTDVRAFRARPSLPAAAVDLPPEAACSPSRARAAPGRPGSRPGCRPRPTSSWWSSRSWRTSTIPPPCTTPSSRSWRCPRPRAAQPSISSSRPSADPPCSYWTTSSSSPQRAGPWWRTLWTGRGS